MVDIEDKELIHEVTNLVYKEFNLTPNVVLSKRDRDIVDAKNMVIYLVKKMTKLSFLKITNNTPIINRKISANRHGYQLMVNLINDTNEFKGKLKEINKVISLTPNISDKYKDRYFYKPKVKYIDVLTTKVGDYLILLPIGDDMICLDYPKKPEMIGKVVNITTFKLKPMKYRPELSPLSDNYFFKEYVKYNRL